jgi:8-oxo-dGTP diphosphatase
MSAHEKVRSRLTEAIAAALADLDQVAGAEVRYRQASWLVDQLAEAITAAGKLRGRAAVTLRDEENLSLAQLGERLGLSKARAADIVRDTTRTAGIRPPEPDSPIVAIVVTAPDGILAVRRTDKNPLWTFPGGEIEPGETPSAAAVRETKEETGLDVVAGRILGKRMHPQTGRQVIYVAGRPARHADPGNVFVGDKSDLDDVRWLTRSQLDRLMPGTYEPVLAYLDRDHRRQPA